MPHPLDDLIRRRFRVRRDDLPPYRGFASAKREQLVSLLAEAGLTRGVEVGVLDGVFSAMLCEGIRGLHLLCVDPWAAYGSGSIEKASAVQAEASYEATRRRLAPYLRPRRHAGATTAELVRLPSASAVTTIPLGTLDFVVLDGDHEFDATMLALIEWSRRVKSGGLIVAHDYEVAYRVGVIEAVHAYTRAHGIRDWYVTRDRVPYAFWVNP
jgi:predicted O-methyltransferase YrrM